MVAGTSPACDSSGFGVTVKLSADSGPIFEHDAKTRTEHAERV